MPSLLLLLFILSGFVVLGLLLRKWIQGSSGKSQDQAVVEWLKTMQSSIENTNKTLNEVVRGSSSEMSKVLQENSRQLNERLDNAAKLISSVQKNLGEMSEVGKGIKTLQGFLQSPKLRGGLGEEMLKNMIGETFPKNSFHLQYSFRSGAKVDAVLKTDAGLLCVDSKFPMENFNRMLTGESEGERQKAKKDLIIDVKKHIQDVSKKYILPEEGTLDFALMYVPSESVYYEVVNTDELTHFARSNRVYPVSPNTLYAHLQVLLLSFQGKELETKSHEIFKLLRGISKDYQKLEESIGVLGRHVTNAHNQVLSVEKGFAQLGQKISLTTAIEQTESNIKKLDIS